MHQIIVILGQISIDFNQKIHFDCLNEVFYPFETILLLKYEYNRTFPNIEKSIVKKSQFYVFLRFF